MRMTVKSATAKRLINGECLVEMDDIASDIKLETIDEGTCIDLYSSQQEFCGKMIVGRQNKGFGWKFTNNPDENWTSSLVYERVYEAIEKRKQWFNQEETNAYRLFNGEGDGIGAVTIDYLNQFIQINWYSKGIYHYRDWFVSSLVEMIPEIKGIYETRRYIHENEAAIQLTYGSEAPQPLIIRENHVNYAVYLGAEWMNGIFMDQRDVRQFMQQQTQGMTVLNLFSYTGAFSVASAVGGASQTVSVDVANRSLERTEENFTLNQMDPSQHEIRVMDVFDYLNYALRHQLTFDCVVCDPPSFARTKKYIFSAERDYGELAQKLIQLTKVGGLLILSTNHSLYSRDKFMKDVVETMSTISEVQLIQSYYQPKDYPYSSDTTSQYLKVFVFYRVK